MMTIYVVYRDDIVIGSFQSLDEAETFMMLESVRNPGTNWTIDEYSTPSEVPDGSTVH